MDLNEWAKDALNDLVPGINPNRSVRGPNDWLVTETDGGGVEYDLLFAEFDEITHEQIQAPRPLPFPSRR